MSGPVLRWVNATIGEVKERSFTWRDPVIWSERAPSVLAGEPRFRGEFDEGEHTALELALGLVADLETVIDTARVKGETVVVRVDFETVPAASVDTSPAAANQVSVVDHPCDCCDLGTRAHCAKGEHCTHSQADCSAAWRVDDHRRGCHFCGTALFLEGVTS